MLMKGKKSSLILLCCLALLLPIYDESVQAQGLPFSFDGSENSCYVQCPMDCPQLNLDMVDCIAYCKIKCACPADDTECATKAMGKMQKTADEEEESEAEDISQAGASDSDAAFAPESEETAAGDLAFAAEDGEVALSPAEASAPEIDTASFVIQMDVSPTTSAGAPTSSQDAGAPTTPQFAPAATPQSAPAAPTPTGAVAPAANPQSAAAPTPTGAVAPAANPQSAAAPTPTGAVAPAPTQQNGPSPAPKSAVAAPGPNAPTPA